MRKVFFPFLFLLLMSSHVPAQVSPAKYPSLLWEITGNGLQKPSYLFGTMHVSSKLVFNLGDSFYNAISKVDAVALELNPDLWQGQMVRLNRLRENYTAFSKQAGNEFLTENTFRINDYVKDLKLALKTEPAVVNGLLYRSYKASEDFEEDTFLDLYIFQTGRRLGKKAAGVEDYYEAEKLMLEAYLDMAGEKKKKNNDVDAEFMSTYTQKIQQAYKNGNLDLMDSLDNIVESSPAFREKFLYRRNEIQANAIDSIIRHASLFAGVGAAHLPGKRGVIELLRDKGYILRPVKMTERDSKIKKDIDPLHVPVVFRRQIADDNFYTVDVPGELYQVKQGKYEPDRRQYADMSNGAYYVVSRVRTYAAFLNRQNQVSEKIDSVLYENIPGKILSKKAISKNGYSGFDISNRTRRGDLQRYQIFITPFEIIIFKMSGKENYVSGKEAECFFSSIQLKEKHDVGEAFQPDHGGFSMNLPPVRSAFLDSRAGDRWAYEALDTVTNTSYLVLKKSLYNFNFLEEDTFDLSLAEISFRNPEFFEDEPLSRRHISVNGLPVLEAKDKLKDGSFVTSRFFVQGPHYYVVAERSKDENPGSYLHTFSFMPYRYKQPVAYSDTFLRATVNSVIVPEIDEGLRTLIERSLNNSINGNNAEGYVSYWPKPKAGLFKSDSTGELFAVQVQEYPKYFYIQDSVKYWQKELSNYFKKKDMYMSGAVQYTHAKDFTAVTFVLRDTGSSRLIRHKLVLSGKYLYTLSALGDTVNGTGYFADQFFETFSPLNTEPPVNIYENRIPVFFADLFSTDSALLSKAKQSITNVTYGNRSVPLIVDAINRLSPVEKDYYATKSKLIAELGYIEDSITTDLVKQLKTIYEKTKDTSLFQNEVIKALSRLETKASYRLLIDLMKDPPIFENNYEINSLFNNLDDSLALSLELFPGLMQLSSLDDYKDKITGLLVKLVDSGLVKPALYKRYFQGIYIDGLVAMKKQKARDERQMQSDNRTTLNDDETKEYKFNNGSRSLYNYAVLLMPFYNKKSAVPDYFNRLLQSRDEQVVMNTAVLMLRNNKPVPDSIVQSLAAHPRFSSDFYALLKKYGKEASYPSRYATQLNFTQSALVSSSDFYKFDSIVFLSKKWVNVMQKSGWVYMYKYRFKNNEQWKIGLSGLQPENAEEINTSKVILSLTGIKLLENDPVTPQLELQLKKVVFGLRKSSRYFYENSERYSPFNDYDD